MSTPSERYTEREDTAHQYEQRLDRESRFRELERRKAAIETYQHLAGVEAAVKELRRVMLQEEIDWHEAERVRLQEEAERIDKPEWSYDDSLEDFTNRFLEFVNTKKG